ncbi:hypothetical protein LCGC14_0739540 [marine sediment metagenome]|uniref:Uncharacterized protein n=1 Tax=marine sediment metagenome TaxID=412755 RepID=A0A0F9QS85_9ZZZZ
MFLNFLKDIDNYEERKVARIDPKDNNGIGVSTVFTPDEGYETALLDVNGVQVVQRYKDKVEAELGHERWVTFAKTADGKVVPILGWSEFDHTFKDVKLKREGKTLLLEAGKEE